MTWGSKIGCRFEVRVLEAVIVCLAVVPPVCAQVLPPASGPAIRHFGVGDASFRIEVDGYPLRGSALVARLVGGPPHAAACVAVGGFAQPIATPFGFSLYPDDFGVVSVALDGAGALDPMFAVASIESHMLGVDFVTQAFAADPGQCH